MKSNLLNRLFTAIASFSLLVNSLGTPLLAIAQEVTPTPTPTDTATPTIEATATPTVTPDLTPTPDIFPTPTIEVTPTPEESLSPSLSPSPEPTVTTETAPTTPGPPSESTPTPDSTTPAPSPSATPEVPQEHGNVSATLLHQTNASTVTESDLGLAQSDSSATLTTNKPDYAPTDAVVITGTGFIANKTYTIEITSQDAPAVDFKDQVKANDKGDIFYTYQLDGNYRPNYKVEVLSGNTLIASVTFTDSLTKIEYSDVEGETGPRGSNSWTKGDLKGYKEGDLVNFRIKLNSPSDTVPATGHIFIGYTSDTACRFFTNEDPQFYSIDSTQGFSLSYIGKTQSSGDLVADFQVNSTITNKNAYLFFTLHLSDNAATCGSGSSQHVQVDHTSGNFKDEGAKSLPIPVKEITPVTDIAISKTAPATASLGGAVSYNLTVTNLDPSTTAVAVVVSDTLPAGVSFVSGSWTKTSPSGSGSCSAVGQVVTCNIGNLAGSATSSIAINTSVASDPQICGTTLTNNVVVSTTTLESNTQNNSAQASTRINACAASITVHKNVLNPDGNEVLDSNNFTVRLDNEDPRTINETTAATYSGLLAGNIYTVNEDSPTDYDLFSITPDGNSGLAGAQVTVVAGNNDVYVVNKQKKATINVSKNVAKPDGQTDVSDNHAFTSLLNGGTGQSFSEQTPTSYTVNPGQYTITEGADGDYTNLGCKLVTGADAGTLFNVPSNSTINVTCKNAQKPATITVEKDVVKSDGSPVDDPNTFSVTLNSVAKDFGEGSPAVYTVDPGQYGATEANEANYTFVSNDGPATVGSNGSATIHIVNKQNAGSISGYKYDATSQEGIADWIIKLYSCSQSFTGCVLGLTTQTDNSGFYSFTNLVTGFYQVVENILTGWTPIGDTSHNVTINPGTVSNEGNDFVNFENATIIVHKNVVGTDGSTNIDDPKQFTALLNSADPKTIAEGTDASYPDLGPGTYTVSEDTAPNGYQFVSITDGGVVTVESGGSYELTITNKQIAATLIVTKHVIKDNGGNEEASDFTINVNGTNVSATGFPGEENGTAVSLDAGNYSVDEDSFDGYTKTLSEDCSGSIAFGETKYCTITNDDIAPTVTLNKEVRSGDAGINDFGLTIGGQGVDSGQTVDVDANTPIALDEAGLNGYSFDSITGDEGCPSGLGGTVTLDEGGSIICTIINTRDTGSISGFKFEDVNGNGNWDEGEPGLDGWTIKLWTGQEDLVDSTETSDDPLGEYRFENIPTGYYAVCEVLEDDWTQTYPEGCHFFTLTQEGEQELDFGNFRLASIGDFIWQDNNGDGVQDIGEPGIAGIQVNLYIDDDGTLGLNTSTDTLVGSETTGGTGGYLFENLGPGQYWTDVVESTLPAGYANTTPDPVGPIILSSGETYLLADVGYVAPEIQISKNNDKPNASAGDTVTYTLKVTNTFDTNFNSISITDVLPGGFTYVDGSSTINGSPTGDPDKLGGTLKWTIDEPEFPITITYKASIGNDLSNGTYKNFATCTAFITRKETEQDCNVADSSVTLGAGQGYGGNLTPQVLGASTELPATGNDTGLLLFTIAAIIGGIAIKVYGRRKKYGKN